MMGMDISMISSEKVQGVLDMIFGDGTDNSSEAIAHRSRTKLMSRLTEVAAAERRGSGEIPARDVKIDAFG